MIRYIIAPTGQILTAISGDAGMVSLNTASDAIYVDTDSNVAMTGYYDFDQYRFVSIGEPPSPHFIFDYGIKQWIDPRSLDEIKAQKWAEIKQQRDHLEFGGFEFEGNIYDSGQISQGRILGAASAGLSQVWTLADNTTVNLTADQLVQIYQALQTHTASVHQRGRIAREVIMSATTKEDVESVTL